MRSNTLPGSHGAVEHVGQQLLDVGAGRGDAAGERDVAQEGPEVGRHVRVLGGADPADRAAGADHGVRGLDRRPQADALQHGVRAVAAGQLPDLRDALLAALGHHVGGAELAAQVGALPCAGP